MPRQGWTLSPRPSSESTVEASPLTKADYLWLEDLYSRLRFHEDELVYQRTSFFLTAVSILAGASSLVYVSQNDPASLRAGIGGVLAWLGIILSIGWGLVVRRTVAALEVWRGFALEMERLAILFFPWDDAHLFAPHWLHQVWSREHSGELRGQPGISPLQVYQGLPWAFLVGWVASLAYAISLVV